MSADQASSSGEPECEPGAPRELAARPRLVLTLLAWAGLFAGGPGTLTPDGIVPLTLLGFALWAAAAHRPGPRAFWIEGFAGALGWAGLMGWAACVWGPLLVWIGPAHGLYVATTGVLLRRLARRLPLPLAAALAWLALETLRGWPPPPFGLQSYQLGHALHLWPELAGSARVWGVGGLGWVLGSAAGLAAFALRRVAPRLGPGAAPTGRDWVSGLAPLAFAFLLAALIPAPEQRPGPRVLLVQPAFEQNRKQHGNRFDNHRENTRMTLEAVAELPEGERPDLVCWGETMVAPSIFDDAVLDALVGGWEPPGWQKRWLLPELIWRQREEEQILVIEELLGRLPEGTNFLSGVEVFQWSGEEESGSAERGNGVAIWRPEGRSEAALKLHVVPGAESMLGLERFDAVRDAVLDIAGYVPNLSAGERTGVLGFTDRDGQDWRVGASVCFDNAFADPYTEPLRRTPVDFHLVVSNEAWYGKTWEAEQMIAYSRVIAMATGRSMVRATNSGVSAIVAADGSDVRLQAADGSAVMVRGTLAGSVPVPLEGQSGDLTPFVRYELFWRLIWPLAGLLLGLGGRRGPRS